MCLLSVYKPGAPVVVEHLEAGAECNPDGHGFAVIAGDRIETGKGMNAAATIAAFVEVRNAHPNGWALFHSRITTDGATNVDNCHPFVVGGDARTVLAHNGILPAAARPRKGDTRSDTRILAELLIPRGVFGSIRRASGRRTLEKWIAKDGYANKVAILTVDPRYKGSAFILGESHGTWVDGAWHSNGGYKPYMPYVPTRRSYAESAAYAGYIAGDYSYAEYLDMCFTGVSKARGVDICPMCQSSADVEAGTGYCLKCRVCLDCEDFAEWCSCYSPSGIPQTDRIDSVPMALRAELGAPDGQGEG